MTLYSVIVCLTAGVALKSEVIFSSVIFNKIAVLFGIPIECFIAKSVEAYFGDCFRNIDLICGGVYKAEGLCFLYCLQDLPQ